MVELIADESYDLNNTIEYNLSIQVSLDGFSFIITDSKNQNLIAFKNELLKISSEGFIARRIEEWIDSLEILKKSYRQVRILFYTNNFTLIPETFYSEEKNGELFDKLFEPVKNRIIKVNTLSTISSKLIFGIQNGLDAELNKRFDNFSYLHPVEILLQNLPETTNSHEGKILLLLSSDVLYVLIFKEKNLLIANSYKHFHFNDIVYFILSNLQQCEIDAGEAKLFMTGNLSGDNQNDIAINLKKYLGSVELLKSSLNFKPEIFDSSEFQNSLFLIK